MLFIGTALGECIHKMIHVCTNENHDIKLHAAIAGSVTVLVVES